MERSNDHQWFEGVKKLRNIDHFRSSTHKCYIRVLHAAQDAKEVDVYFNHRRVIKSMPFKQVSQYLPINEEKIQVDIYPTGTSSQTLFSKKVIPKPNSYITIVMFGNEHDFRLKHFIDDFHVPYGETKFKCIHVASLISNLDIAVQNGDVVFPNVKYRQETPYLPLTPMTVSLEGRVAGTKEILLKMNHLTFYPNQTYSIYFVNDQTLDYWILMN